MGKVCTRINTKTGETSVKVIPECLYNNSKVVMSSNLSGEYDYCQCGNPNCSTICYDDRKKVVTPEDIKEHRILLCRLENPIRLMRQWMRQGRTIVRS